MSSVLDGIAEEDGEILKFMSDYTKDIQEELEKILKKAETEELTDDDKINLVELNAAHKAVTAICSGIALLLGRRAALRLMNK